MDINTVLLDLDTKYRAMLINTALGITKNREDAEDAVQDAYIGACRTYKNFDHSVTLCTWMRKIVKRKAIDKVRKKIGRNGNRPIKVECLDECTSHLYTLPHNPFIEKEIKWAIGKLSKKQRDVVNLVLVNGYKYKQAAEMLNMRIGTAHATVNHARAKLKKLLEL